jgi:hypothetical protein
MDENELFIKNLYPISLVDYQNQPSEQNKIVILPNFVEIEDLEKLEQHAFDNEEKFPHIKSIWKMHVSCGARWVIQKIQN